MNICKTHIQQWNYSWKWAPKTQCQENRRAGGLGHKLRAYCSCRGAEINHQWDSSHSPISPALGDPVSPPSIGTHTSTSVDPPHTYLTKSSKLSKSQAISFTQRLKDKMT